MKTIIAGSRGFRDYELLLKVVGAVNWPITEVVSGGARGADSLGERWALANNISIVQFIPNWNTLGRSAGHIRNAEMSNYADACIVFWDGISAGSRGMINLAKCKAGMLLHIEQYNVKDQNV